MIGHSPRRDESRISNVMNSNPDFSTKVSTIDMTPLKFRSPKLNLINESIKRSKQTPLTTRSNIHNPLEKKNLS